ncbi:TolC family protein [Spirochaeta africana]|uniref:Outer membrane protein n=1 Tax=Spirochaeta africana (strain ATCC 700263 / DSM 8902 / Z-7692) TaxID=889378 RepID=H9UHU3_SPIAZ|nr:TolC family protein [Spirochaeta africana]AFG37086.1 outer membrane protein [Spirochaeta africana DSM 8902]
MKNSILFFPVSAVIPLLAIILFLIAPPLFGQDAVEITLAMAIEQALYHNQQIGESLLEVRRAEAAYTASRHGRFPSLLLSAGYERVRDTDPPILSLPEQFGGDQQLGESVPDRVKLAVLLQQELFTGYARTSEIALREAEMLSATHRQAHTESGAVLSATELFYAGVLAGKRVEASRQALERAREGRRELENLHSEGLATRNELLRVYMAEREAEDDLRRAENEERRSHLRIARALGYEPGQTIILMYDHDFATRYEAGGNKADSPESIATSVLSDAGDGVVLADAVESALRTRRDLAAAAAGIAAADERVIQARSSLYPRLAANASVLHARPSPGVFPADDSFETTWSVGLELSYNIGGIPAARARTDEARAVRNQAQLDYERRSEDVALEVRERALDLDDAFERVRNTELMSEQAEENLRVTESMYEEGLARFTEVLEARELESRAKLLLLEARIGVELASARFKFAQGGGID